MGFSFVGKGSNRHFQCEIVKLDGSRRLLSMGTGWRPLDEFRGLFCVRGSGVRKMTMEEITSSKTGPKSKQTFVVRAGA